MSDALINGLAGAGGGIIAQLITYPLQTVNTRQQTDRDHKKGTKRKQDVGTLKQMIQVVNTEGWGRLYSGLAPSLFGTAASQGVYYYFYQVFRSKAEAAAIARFKKGHGDGTVGIFSSLLVAAFSGCVNVLLTNPIWVVVTRMQTHRKASKLPKPSLTLSVTPDEELQTSEIEPPPYGTTNAVQELFDEAGIRGFWKGVGPTLLMVSNPSIQFMIYETLLKKLKARRALTGKANSGVTALETFLLGAVAKLGATVMTYPLLVVKSRLQAKQVTGGDKNLHYKGTMDAIMKMIQYEGLYCFYRGMSTKITQSVLAAAVLFMVKEELVKGVRLLTTGNIVNKVRRPV
ncbi:peroxisomal nicotinamide adenine dinucleotide carrier-like [Papaver somniferum]|uniref:peroxisomal nicotinamide adenine dinucleotide carrier-like n=1 Tax=Papaver somniferum TaxID=3469 RepID=UPI000E6F52C6|nr:peroxisomal nicotinamide adenine dinucleotide carrier-like [Papaver somniferum]